MRLGINALFLRPGRVGGTETYLRAFVTSALSRPEISRVTLFVGAEVGSSFFGASEKLALVRLPFSAEWRGARLLWEQLYLPRRLRAAAIDLLLSPGYTAPLRPPCPNVVLLPDLHCFDRPQDLPWLDRLAHRLLVAAALPRAQRIIVLSEAMRQSLARHFPALAGRTWVCPPAPPAGVPPAAAREEALLVNIATTHPHKNQLLLVEMLERLQRDWNLTARLWILGIGGFGLRPLCRRIERSPLAGQIELSINAPRARLEEALGRGTLFVFPTLYEGWGLAPLEAMASGLPVVASDLPVCRQALGEGADYCPPQEAASWAAKVAELLRSPPARQGLAERGGRWLSRPEQLAGRERLWQALLDPTIRSPR